MNPSTPSEPGKLQSVIKSLSSDISRIKSCLASIEERFKLLETRNPTNPKQSYSESVKAHNETVRVLEDKFKEHERMIIALKKELDF